MAHFAGIESFSTDVRTEGRHFKETGHAGTGIKDILSGNPEVVDRKTGPLPSALVDNIVGGTTTQDADEVPETRKRNFFPEHDASHNDASNMALSLMAPLETAKPHGQGLRTFFAEAAAAKPREGGSVAGLLGGQDAGVSMATFVPTLDVDKKQLKGSSGVQGLLSGGDGAAPKTTKQEELEMVTKQQTTKHIKVFKDADANEISNVLSQVAPAEAPPVPPPVDTSKENSAALASLLAIDDALADTSGANVEPPQKQARKIVMENRRTSQMAYVMGKPDTEEPKRKLGTRHPNLESSIDFY